MIQDLTTEDIIGRFEVLDRHLDNAMEGFADEYEELESSEFESTQVRELIRGSIMYLHRIGATKLVLHSSNDRLHDNYLFTATKNDCHETAVDIDENDVWGWGMKPIDKIIEVPNLFENCDTKEDAVSLVIDFPDNNLGSFCRKMIELLKSWDVKDVDIINLIIFMDYYFHTKSGTYSSCVWNVFLGLFEVDSWDSRYQMPLEIQSIITHTLRFKNRNIGNVYDPFMRTGMNWWLREGKYHADAQDMFHYYAMIMICGIHGEDWENIKYNDCIENWNPSDCDTIIATPELNKIITSSNNTEIPIGEWLLNKMLSSFDTQKRQALLVLPSNILYSGGEYQKLRHDLTEKNLLDAVISLPTNIFAESGAASAIILLSNEREIEDAIWMVDLASVPMKHEDENDEDSRMIVDKELAIKIISEQTPKYVKTIFTDDVKNNEYNWFTTSYLKQSNDIPIGFMKVKIRELLDSNVDVMPTLGNFAIVTDEKLKESPFEDNRVYADNEPPQREWDFFGLSTTDIKDYMESHREENFSLELLTNAYKSNPPKLINYANDVLIVNFQDKVKTAWFEQESHLTTVKVSRNLEVFHVNKDVINPDYLRWLIYDLVNNKQNFENDNCYPSCLEEYILGAEIIIPMSVDEQKHLYEQAKLNHLVEKARKEGLDEAIDRMKEEYINEVRMRKHDMNPFISQLLNLPENVEMYLDEIEGNEEPVTAIREKMDVLLNTVIDLREHLNRLTEEEIYGEPEIVNILSFLKKYVGVFPNYSIELQVDSVAIEDSKANEGLVSINPIDLSTLISTIVENAILHGFIRKDISYHMLIYISVEKDTDCYIIDLKNDGEPMPLGINKYKYGLRGEKSANSKGSGLGGYRVKSIVRHYGGDYDVICRRNLQTSTTTIRVLLPIYRSK